MYLIENIPCSLFAEVGRKKFRVARVSHNACCTWTVVTAMQHFSIEMAGQEYRFEPVAMTSGFTDQR